MLRLLRSTNSVIGSDLTDTFMNQVCTKLEPFVGLFEFLFYFMPDSLFEDTHAIVKNSYDKDLVDQVRGEERVIDEAMEK